MFKKIKPTLITNFEPNKFDYVIHISDVHIKVNERHDEYIKVFEKLYIDINLILGGYTMVLLISQRDIRHISEYEIKISKINNISKII